MSRALGVVAGTAALAGLALLALGVLPVDLSPAAPVPPPATETLAVPLPPTPSPSQPSPPPSPSASPRPAPAVLRLPGPVPTRGSGIFEYAATAGPVRGRSGTLLRYRVAVERGAGEDIDEFGAVVDAALGHARSWTAGGLRMQRVPRGGPYNFTIHLATRETAGRMCGAGGVDITVRGRPYTSCRVGGGVIINLDRWRLSVDHFVAAEVPLSLYRDYVVNHEVGHQLGHRHELCPGRGRPAPVMMQQTLGLKGCTANPWPFVSGHRYAGPLK
ncbi:DUF3152 domain-containing protein [Phytohabitans sp. ZYX-F-186]|uniref:DUF3152 domain-containing protein n=1 Tax=Phytohabitans maris TaxID=3071409 RepID=A0ABU0Z8X1_9ACTN|nr:DUF3152 domain-containing protein [Phytohabitans sp. ZYX-F-186]MDQ7903443.1 DUF3152 domain-containing protein [Phytohabitans sp. ZYX-F-186]